MTEVLLAESPLALLDRMSADLAAIRDPWARHWLVLPSVPRAEHLRQSWAARCGIASRSQVMNLRTVLESAAAGGGSRETFSREALTLRVAAALPRHAADLPLPPGVVQGHVDGRALAWARLLADAIDQGLLCRPAPARFGAAPFLEALVRDPEVSPALEHHLGSLGKAAFGERARAWVDDWRQREGVPHLWIQLDAGLPDLVMARLRQLLALLPAGAARLYALASSLGYWADLAAGARARRVEPERDPGPVLRSLGLRARDLHQQLAEDLLAEGSGGTALPSPEPGAHLLGRLQHSCRRAARPDEPRALDPGDGSFGVHACRSPLRELEICRDRILEAFHADSSLAPEDVLVLVADRAAYMPLVVPAFQPQTGATIPVQLLGGGATPSLLVAGLETTLTAVTGRLTRTDLLRLVEQPLVARRFDLEEAERAEALEWLRQARFTWGVDGDHREAEQGARLDAWHLSAALRRLALGAIVSPEVRDGVVEGCAPLDRAGGLATVTLARLAALVDAIAEARSAWAVEEPAELSTWKTRLTDLLAAFVDQGGPADQQHRGTLLRKVRQLEALAPENASLTSDGFRRLIAPILEELEATIGGGGGGGVRVGDLAGLAGVPAKVICICGLGEARFPRSDDRPTWHPLSSDRRPGDPQRRDDDRHRLLLATLSAQDRVVLTYEGGSEADAKPRPPSTPLADLLDAARACCAPEDHERLEHRHPLNGFSPAALDPAAPLARRSFLPADAVGAQALAQARRGPPSGLCGEVLDPEPEPPEIRRSDIRALFREPCQLFLRRLGVALPRAGEAVDGRDRLDLDGLEAWEQREALLDRRLRSEDEVAWQQRLAVGGDLPVGGYGHRTWAKISKDTPTWSGGPLIPVTPPDAIQVTDGRGISWTLEASPSPQWWRDGDGNLHCFTTAKKPTEEVAAAWLPYLFDLLVQRHAAGADAVTVHFRNEKKPTSAKLVAPPRQEAEARLREIVELVALARRLPLPWWRDCHDALVDRGADMTSDALRERAWSASHVWTHGLEGRPYEPTPPADEPATRLCFRGLDAPFSWAGPPEPDEWAHLPHPELPLALRLVVALHTWQRAVQSKGGSR